MDDIVKPPNHRASAGQLKRDSARIQSEIAGTDGGIDPFPAAVRATRMPMVITDPRQPDNPIVFANDAFCRLTGYGREEVIGRNCRFLQGLRTDPGEVARLREAIAARQSISLDICNYKKDGTLFWNRLLLAPVNDANGELAYFFASQLDITPERERMVALEGENASLTAERAATLARLEFSEESLRLATEAAEIGTWDLDVLTNRLSWSDRTKAMFGISSNVTPSMDDFYAGLHPEDREATSAAFTAALDPAVRATYDVEYRTIGKEDGVMRWVAAKGRGFFDASGRCVRALGTTIDVTHRRRAEAELRSLNTKLEARVAEVAVERDRVWHNSRDLLVVIGADGIFRAANPAWTTILGLAPEDVVGRHFRDLIWPGDVEATERTLEDAVAARHLTNFENRYRHKDGTPRWISWRTSLEGNLAYGYGRDVTAEKEAAAQLEQAQDALRQAQKMEAVGQLTGGIAHDFNNLLTVIRSAAEFLRRRELSEERREKYLAAISDTADRAAKLTGQLLAFARQQPLKPEVFEVGRQVTSVAELIRPLIGSRIMLNVHLPDALIYTEADVTQFETALVNLAVNARDAMQSEGQLTITVKPEPFLPALRRHARREGSFVSISVQDTGAGIVPEHLTRIFEPFFTTKEVGKGTGLGLSQVFGFAKQSGGDVEVQSEVGQGTCFSIYLRQSLQRPETAGAASVGVGPALGYGARVLMAEDNKDVGEFASQMLQDLGYDVTWVPEAHSALALLAEDDLRFDIVFTDVIMPGMSGIDLGREINRLYPGLPVVLTSGYSHILAEEGRHGFELLQKPYAVEGMSRALRKVIRQRASRPL